MILKDGKILLIKRVKPGQEYFIFPGGGVDAGESLEQALVREVKEELCLDVKKQQFIFSIENLAVPQFITVHKGNRDEYYFLVEEYAGVPEIGGPEKERMNEQNQYHIAWLALSETGNIKNLYPREGVARLAEVLSSI